MEILHTVADCRAFLEPVRGQGRTIGFVPTMGALHEGHLSLMRRARQECGLAIACIFVNPTQFGPHEDFARYPRDLERDADLCRSVAVDALFAPEGAEMYPEGFATYVVQDDETACRWEGEIRPGHFRGVLTVVAKLFHIVQPDRAYFGQKDYQQALLVRRMARDLGFALDIVVCDTLREPDGLAMSSRNQYLDPASRRQAACIHRGLRAAEAQLAAGQRDGVRLSDTIRQTIVAAGPCTIDYVTLADPETLAPVEEVNAAAVALVAVRIGGTRLIDNLILHP
jgi:pantoate--beta-alanine ligase